MYNIHLQHTAAVYKDSQQRPACVVFHVHYNGKHQVMFKSCSYSIHFFFLIQNIAVIKPSVAWPQKVETQDVNLQVWIDNF